MQKLLNAMRLQALMASNNNPGVRLAQVSSYDPAQYAVKLLVMPEGIETGWLPIGTIWSGNGWGLFCPPSSGDIVEVEFQEGDISAGITGWRLYNDGQRPLSVQGGEFWLVHQSGSLLKFHNDGTVELTSSGTLTVKATSILLQNAGSLLKKLVNETFLAWFDGHTHTCAAPGSQSAIPTQQTSTSGSPLKTATTQAE